VKNLLALTLLLACSSSIFAANCVDFPLPTEPEDPTWSRTISTSSSESADLTVWRKDCGDGTADLLFTIEARVGSPFICSIRFDVVQGGVQSDNVNLLQDPNSPNDRFCDDLLVKSTFYIGLWSTGTPWDRDEAFTLVYDSDQTLEVGAFTGSGGGGGGGTPGEREDFPLPEYEQLLPSEWFFGPREGDFSVASLPNHITLPTVVPNGCMSVIPTRFQRPPSQVIVDETYAIDDLAGDAVNTRIRVWRQGCHEPGRSVILMNLELLDQATAGLAVEPFTTLVPQGGGSPAVGLLSEFAVQTAAEVPWFSGVGLTNAALRVEGTELQTGTTYVVDAFQYDISPDAYNSNLEMRLDFGQDQFVTYDLPSYSPSLNPPQQVRPALHGRYSGQWVVEGLPRSGLVLQVAEIAPARNFVFAIWFTYLDGEPIWVVGNADIELGADSVVLDMLRLEGGGFFTDPGSFSADDVSSEVLGTMTLRAVHCGEIEGEIDFSGSGLGQQDLVFSRLINIAGSTCDQTQ
jgi:hypothetical protein